MNPANPSPTPETSEPRAGGDRARTESLILLLSLASVVWIGYRFGGGNHAVQIPLLKHLVDPSLYSRDLLVSSLAGYVSWFFWALVPLVRLAGGLELPFFMVFVVLRWATLRLVYALAMRLFNHEATAWASCLLFIANPGSLGGEGTLSPRLHHGTAAVVLVLASLLLYFRGRVVAAFAVCGLAFNVHALYAAYLGAMLAVDCAVRQGRRRAAGALPPLAALVAAAAPSLLWLVRAREVIPEALVPQWLEIMRQRSALHAFPLSSPAHEYASYVLFLAFAGLGLALQADGSLRRTIVRFAAAVLGLCVVGLVFSEWLPVPLVVKAQLLRSTKWLTVLALIPLARVLSEAWGWGGLTRAGAALAAAAFALPHAGLLAPALVLLLLGSPRRFGLGAAVAGSLALWAKAVTSGGAEPADLASALGNLAGSLADPRLVFCLGAFLVQQAARTAPLRVAVLAACAVYVLPSLYLETLWATRQDPWVQAQIWVRDNTPRDAVLLTPPFGDGFRTYSERAIVGEWKDGTQQFFSAAFAFEWDRRMRRLKGETRAYERFDAETLLELGRAYGAEFAVMPAETVRARRLDLPKLFQNEVAVVYRLVEAGGSGAEGAR